MNKIEAYNEAQKFGAEAGFVANVVINHHRNAARKLKGLVEILKAGHDVRTAQFGLDILMIDGTRQGWEVLEAPGVVKGFVQSARTIASDRRYEKTEAELRVEDTMRDVFRAADESAAF